MDGWMDEWIEEWRGGCIDIWMIGYINRFVDGWIALGSYGLVVG